MGSNDLKFQFSNPASNGFEIEAIGAYQGDVFHVHQHTGNPGANTHLVHLESEDSDVTGLRVSGASVRDIKANCIIETACVFSGAGLIADKAISGASIFSGATAVSVQGHSHPETDDIWIVQSGGYVASGAYVKNWETQSGGYTTSGAMVAHMNQISGANVAHYADTNKHVSGALTAYMALASGSSVAHMAQASGAFVAHLADGINPHGVQTITNLSGGSVSVTSDVTTNSGAHVLNIVRATNATPPTASNFPQGTIYVQYTP